MRPAGRLAENAIALCINVDDTQSLALCRKFHAGPIPVGKMPSLLPLCPNLDSGAEELWLMPDTPRLGRYHGPSMATAATKVGGSYLSIASMIR